MNMTLRLAAPAAFDRVDDEIDRMVAILARHAQAARVEPQGDTQFAGRDRRRWSAAKALIVEIAAGHVLPREDASGSDDLPAAIERLYELWPAASTSTYLEVHDLGLDAARRSLAALRRSRRHTAGLGIEACV